MKHSEVTEKSKTVLELMKIKMYLLNIFVPKYFGKSLETMANVPRIVQHSPKYIV